MKPSPRQTHPKLFNPEDDGYFRFPLAALAHGGEPIASLNAIINCGVVNAGIGLRQTSLSHYQGLLAASDIWGAEFLKLDPGSPEIPQLNDVCAGLQLMRRTTHDWRRIRDSHAQLTQPQHTGKWWPEPPQSQALVTMKASWVWHALYTERHWRHSAANVPEDWDPTRQWLSWREFRVLCAVLSVIGKKPFAWISTATLAHRVLGFTSAKFHRIHLAKEAATRSGVARESASARSASSHGAHGERLATPNGIASASQKGRSATPGGIAHESHQQSSGGRSVPSQGQSSESHLAPLSRWQIESTLADLEKNRFFLRFRASRSTTGRGGRTAYSIRHKTRAKLARDIQSALTRRRERGPATLSENRGKDVVLWSRIEERSEPVDAG